jgi:hypothetical protein
VAAWRKAQQVGTTDDAKHTLLQFRAATQMLELAQEYNLPDDAVVMATLLSNTNGEAVLSKAPTASGATDAILKNPS